MSKGAVIALEFGKPCSQVGLEMGSGSNMFMHTIIYYLVLDEFSSWNSITSSPVERVLVCVWKWSLMTSHQYVHKYMNNS